MSVVLTFQCLLAVIAKQFLRLPFPTSGLSSGIQNSSSNPRTTCLALIQPSFEVITHLVDTPFCSSPDISVFQKFLQLLKFVLLKVYGHNFYHHMHAGPQAEIFRRGFVRYGRGFWGRSRLPEALGYLVQNPAIQQFPDTSFTLSGSPVFHY